MANLTQKAVASFNAGRFDEALGFLREAVAAGDRSAGTRCLLGHALNSAGRAQEAIETFMDVIAESPAHEPAYEGLTGVLIRRGGVESAAAALTALAAAWPPAAAERARAQAARLAPKADIRKAPPAGRKAGRANPRAARDAKLDALRAKARELQSAGRRPEAMAAYRRILALAPRDAGALLGLGTVQWISGKVAQGRATLARALALDRRRTLRPSLRFKALMKLGRHKEAVALAEKILDGAVELDHLRTFWDPWEWDERLGRPERLAELAALERSLGPKPSTPWLHYYRGELLGPASLSAFEKLAGFPKKRYGWMFHKAATAALLAGKFEKAREWYEIALAREPIDWRAHAFLGETCLCLKRPAEAYAAIERALASAPPTEKSQVLAWRGAFDLWLGRYEDALVPLEEAARDGAMCALCWKGAAQLLLGREEEALATLDETLRLYPLDFEAYVWRGEAKRRLGRPREALADLNAIEFPAPGRAAPISLWALVNRALVHRDLGDEAAMLEDFRALPDFFTGYVKAKTKLEDPAKLLLAALELARGFRREDHGQAIWMD